LSVKLPIEEHFRRARDLEYPVKRQYKYDTGSIYKHYREQGVTDNVWGAFLEEAKKYCDADVVTVNNDDKQKLDIPDNINWRSLIEHAEKHKQIIEGATPKIEQQKTFTWETNKKAVILMASGDYHLNSLSTDYNEMMVMIDSLINSEDTKMVVCGDMTENMFQFRNRKPAQQQIYPKPVQDLMAAQILIDLHENKKLIAVLEGGNHDWEMDERVIGVSVLEMLLRANKLYGSVAVPLVKGQARVTIKLNDLVYETLLIHKTRFSSFLHNLHGIKRTMERIHLCDIAIGAHTHSPGYEWYIFQDVVRHVAKVGSFKTDDDFSMRYYTRGYICTPCFILRTDKKEIIHLPTLEYAQMLRDKINNEPNP